MAQCNPGVQIRITRQRLHDAMLMICNDDLRELSSGYKKIVKITGYASGSVYSKHPNTEYISSPLSL